LYTAKALIFKKFDTFKWDPDPNLFGFCSAPEPEPDPNGDENQELDPNKVSSDPQHCFKMKQKQGKFSFYGSVLKIHKG